MTMLDAATEAPTADTLIADALANPINVAILERLPRLRLDQPWLVAGCVYGPAWNRLSGRPPAENIKDYDIFYWDEDTSWQAEDRVIKAAMDLFADLGVVVELKNQKRVPLWYPEKFGTAYPPIGDAAQSIGLFQITCTCVGLAPGGDGRVRVHAPHGLDDLYAGILRPNPLCPSSPARRREKAESYRARWPWLRIAED
ncbi:hypothetical protein BAL199_08303 [alpha proteobacterium BAL199]|nr:hypothetical protein BAL199_08303 [alpha proteobacterium BAL199]